MRTALIDADSIVYIIAWKHKDTPEFAEELIYGTCDEFVGSILATVKADTYIGVFSAKKCFRHDVYKVKEYKGNRPEVSPDYIVKWKSSIENHLITKWGFHKSLIFEADDIVVCAQGLILGSVICTPDKDLKQVAGNFYDYTKPELGVVNVTKEQALINFWTQMLIGDPTDNILGVPGVGPAKVRKILDDLDNSGEEISGVLLYQTVLAEYVKYYQTYYGTRIFNETLDTIMLLNPEHSQWTPDISNAILEIRQVFEHTVPEETAPEDAPEAADISKLGWKI